MWTGSAEKGWRVTIFLLSTQTWTRFRRQQKSESGGELNPEWEDGGEEEKGGKDEEGVRSHLPAGTLIAWAHCVGGVEGGGCYVHGAHEPKVVGTTLQRPNTGSPAREGNVLSITRLSKKKRRKK
jgi:hypothetical protein